MTQYVSVSVSVSVMCKYYRVYKCTRYLMHTKSIESKSELLKSLVQLRIFQRHSHTLTVRNGYIKVIT